MDNLFTAIVIGEDGDTVRIPPGSDLLGAIKEWYNKNREIKAVVSAETNAEIDAAQRAAEKEERERREGKQGIMLVGHGPLGDLGLEERLIKNKEELDNLFSGSCPDIYSVVY